MKKFMALALILALMAPIAFAAEQEAKTEGYILRVAMDASQPASCPTGFSLLNDQEKSSISGGRVQVFACVKD